MSSAAASFVKAELYWDLDGVLTKLSVAKKATLTPKEKEYVQALLLGYRPYEIADLFHTSRGGVRVALSPVYEYARTAFDRTVDSRNFAQVFRENGYERSPDSKPLPPIPPDIPQPIADVTPDHPSGQIDVDSTLYLDRPPIEERCYQTILKPGALIRIRAARQMGKTSLMMRILHHAKQQNYQTVFLTLQEADRDTFTSLDRFLQWFCTYVTQRLDLPDQVAKFWNPNLGSKVSCEAYFEQYLLAKLDYSFVLALDEIDRLFDYPEVAEDFLGLLRVWNEKGKQRGIWQQFKLILVHSTEVYIPMAITQSPFNVGLPITLPDFTLLQVQELVRRHRLILSDAELEQLMALVGGHPFLIRVALYHLAYKDFGLVDLLANAATESGVYRDHLRRHLWNLEQYPELEAAFRQVVEADAPVRLRSIHAFKLQSMGLVDLYGNQVKLRYGLYREYFRDRFHSS